MRVRAWAIFVGWVGKTDFSWREFGQCQIRLEWLGKTWGRDENGDFLWKITVDFGGVAGSRTVTDRAWAGFFLFSPKSRILEDFKDVQMPRGKGRLEWLGKTWGRDENGDFLWKITVDFGGVAGSRTVTDRAWAGFFLFSPKSRILEDFKDVQMPRWERKITRVLLYFPKINGMRIYMP
ncbi:hypothetical protein Adt_44794 [Abeliophyllum distichum]|uniref:Uncharacterized protein n=2 Tax=Abeliophyllum distichum TaxID=126358 RepID=A0ABD1PBV3_9LAMI